MKKFFSKYISENNWLIKEEGWDKTNQSVRESQFALGNGYIGSRGLLEEIPYDSQPGTYIAGIYDKSGARVTELVNMPNPIDFRISADTEKIDVAAMDVVEHKRILDMKKGLLLRKTIFANARKEKFEYQSMRFFSMNDVHTAAMRVYFTPLDRTTHIVVTTGIDASVTNRGLVNEGRKKHFRVTEIETLKDINFINVTTFERKISAGYAAHLKVSIGKKQFTTSENMIQLKIKKGQSVCFTRTFSIYTSREIKDKKIKPIAINALRKSVKKGFETMVSSHIKAWRKKWDIADVVLKPDMDTTRALRFNIYHMLICGSEKDFDASIGARTLSGDGYRGHVFWDTEIFILPFFIYTNPRIARNILSYRYRRLGMALKNAKQKKLKGALFPWESADTGVDTTPSWHRNLDGTIIKVRTGEFEHHIVGDIAYAIIKYYLVTHDENFMMNMGLEMIFETARFWASRVKHDKKKGTYHINHVIGPDEFHEDVNDNAYTNFLAIWNLKTACFLYRKNRKEPSGKFTRLVNRLNLKDEEIKSWSKISSGIVIRRNKKGDVIEEFAGYFKKKYIPIKEFDRKFMPILPKDVPAKDLNKTQFVKQADVVMLLHLFRNEFYMKEKCANFDFYEKRTLHKSSLSPSTYSIIAAQTGNVVIGYSYFLQSLYSDLDNLHGNTPDGIHAACLGGSWQAVINGFCGMHVDEDMLCFDPRLPADLEVIRFKIFYRGVKLACSAYSDKIEIIPQTKAKEYLHISAFKRIRKIIGSKRLVIKKKGG